MEEKHSQITEAMQFIGAMLQIESEIMEQGQLRDDRGGEERRLGHREGEQAMTAQVVTARANGKS